MLGRGLLDNCDAGGAGAVRNVYAHGAHQHVGKLGLAISRVGERRSGMGLNQQVGGRDGGAITAAQFLQRFVKPEVPWCHLDIAGTALLKAESTLAPKGATGWGVMALNRLIRDRYEAK